VGLNGRVRDGNGCIPHAITTSNSSKVKRGERSRSGDGAPFRLWGALEANWGESSLSGD
jgi:hypothetical protein